MKEIHITIQGAVQGVNFRYYTQEQARSLGLSGWVKNTAAGGVEIIAQGDQERLQALLEWCQQGPTHANVEKVESAWQEPETKYTGFEIKY